MNQLQTFKELLNNDRIVFSNDIRIPNVINEWAQFLVKQQQRGFINLFITGSGVSDVVPNLIKIIEKLNEEYNTKRDQRKIDRDEEIESLFHSVLIDGKEERSIVARLLNAFQEKTDLRKHVWQEINTWLFNEIYAAEPTPFHKNLVKVTDSIDVICLTLNFDGLLVRAMRANDKNRPFSLPTCIEFENYCLREKDSLDGKKEFLEIQIRGDILYVFCDSESFCPQQGKEIPLWSFHATSDDLKKEWLLRCPSCGKERSSLLSFPGSTKKENDMKEMLSIIWKYCAFRVGSVTTVGISGKWDPLIVAFLGDLLSEREIPLLVIDKTEEKPTNGKNRDTASYLVKELVVPELHNSICLNIGADNFMKRIANNIDAKIENSEEIAHDKDVIDDKYWHNRGDLQKKLNKNKQGEHVIYDNIFNSLDLKCSALEEKINEAIQKEFLTNFAQLGLKSYWLGISDRDHNRYNHSVGVMKIATLLYDRALINSGIKVVNEQERQFLRLAALLHDVGHLPFSHLIESVFQELNWKPAGYSDNYSHVLQTEEKIEYIFSRSGLAAELEQSGYCVKDLVNLVHGRFGVPYLDAIINSPLDADKIDYIFRDTKLTERRISLSHFQFLRDVYEGISLSPEKFLTISKTASRAFAELLSARKFLYHSLYLQPSILILEGIVKLILKTYFAHYLKLDDGDIIDELKPKVKDKGKDIPDLGEYKIKYCVNELLKIMKQEENNKNIELAIIKVMFDKITAIKDRFNTRFFDNIEKGWNLVNQTNDENQMKAIEQKMVVRSFNTMAKADYISEISRDVEFRIPEAAIIELRKLPKYLSIADSRKEKERSDGTNACAECILVPDGQYKFWNSASKIAKALQDSSLKDDQKNALCVYLYPLSGYHDNTYFGQAVNLFDKMTKREGID